MKLLAARIMGFQSFGDSGDIEFEDGINLIVGQNNVGKSALLRALQPELMDDRHRTPDRWENEALPRPDIRLTITVSGSEFRTAILRQGGATIPVPPDQDASHFIDVFFAEPMIPVSVVHRPGHNFASPYPGHGLFASTPSNPKIGTIIQSAEGHLNIVNNSHDSDDSIPLFTYLIWKEKMFSFSAERMNIGISDADIALRLRPNADNLPSVLLTLQGNRGDIFKSLVGHLRSIFPTVGNVSVAPIGGERVEVRVWPTEAMERVELSFPLLQSGTGVAQVMAILTAVMTVESAVIIIDEINSFLHPAAVKALLRILQTDYPHHQYIISTHAPEVIGFSNPRTVHLVKRSGYESTIHRLALTEISALREVANHLGVSMADVFAADRIIWVEGPTEELCFPLIYQRTTGMPLPQGIIFTSVVATGDFIAKRRDREMVYQVYKRLSQAATPLVTAVAFSFDSEELKDRQKATMRKESKETINFLPRRHIECYLINAEALLRFIRERDVETALEDVLPVEKMLKDLASGDFKIAEWQGDLSDPVWLAKVDAANLIATACAALSEQRVSFNKKGDTLALMQLVQSVAGYQLDELSAYVRSLVDAVS